MADIILFNDGADYLLSNGLPATVYFLLSTRNVDGAGTDFVVTDTLAGGVGEITGTGYVRQSQSEPTPVDGVAAFAAESFATGAATNWPSGVRSVVAATSADNSGVALWAQNLQTGGAARDMSAANTTETVTPSLTLSAA